MPKKKSCNAELSAVETEKIIKNRLPKRVIVGCKTIVYPDAYQNSEQLLASLEKREPAVRVRVLPLSAYEACLHEFADAATKDDILEVGLLSKRDVTDHARPLVLNFASDSNPGGGWRSNQQGTQEETLCRGSTLGLRLEQQFQTGEYLSQSAHSAIYLDNIQVFHMCAGASSSSSAEGAFLAKPLTVAVVAAALRDCDRNQEFLQKKIAGILRIAAENRHRMLVLGAWGCGAFGNDPELVAKTFHTEILRYANLFDEIIFAIPGNRKKNFQVFQRILEAQHHADG
eukprot:TRINITY_DN61761_c0_g1_i1.p1 TRINITY_DN61761_c0_g1~~TRINITY_DN61761_c0_g1_i1.p1  ORF type:complete len:286 (+),score=52.04 TRINITY_DN61761_c0_g1_i1:91-948(+)